MSRKKHNLLIKSLFQETLEAAVKVFFGRSLKHVGNVDKELIKIDARKFPDLVAIVEIDGKKPYYMSSINLQMIP